MTEKLSEAERRSIRRLIQQARAKTRWPTGDDAIDELQDDIRLEANELEKMLLAERMQ